MLSDSTNHPTVPFAVPRRAVLFGQHLVVTAVTTRRRWTRCDLGEAKPRLDEPAGTGLNRAKRGPAR